MASVLNRKRKFFFLHIPKTAGRSVAALLEGMDGSKLVKIPTADKARGLFPTSAYFEYRRTQLELNERIGGGCRAAASKLTEWRNLYKFCFVRNPYDRAYSAFQYCTKIESHGKVRHLFGEPTPSSISFSDFIRLPSSFNYEVKNHFHISQTQYIFGFNTDFNYIGKYENIESDLESISAALGVKFGSLSRRNQSPRKSGGAELSQADRILIEEMFADDFKNFGYKMIGKS